MSHLFTPPSAQSRSGTRIVPVWDLPTRLFHWSLVALVAFLWISGEIAIEWHVIAGQAVLALVLFRVIWGILGSGRSRFADFVAGPRTIAAHLAEMVALLRGDASVHRPSLGHTPLGGWMILALLTLLAIQAGTGLFATDDIATDGPLAHLLPGHTVKLLTTIHKLNFNLLLACVAVHVSAVLFYLLRAHENLVRPMIFGHKAVPSDMPVAPPRMVSPGRALVVLAVAGAAVATLARI